MVSQVYGQFQGRERMGCCEGDLRPQRERQEGGRRKYGREKMEGKKKRRKSGEKEGGDQGRQEGKKEQEKEGKKRMKGEREEEGGKEGGREPTEFLTEQYSWNSHRTGLQMC